MASRTRAVAGLCLVLAFAAPVAVVDSVDAGGSTPVAVQRIYGTDAIGTSIAISQSEFPSAHTAEGVVLARSDFFADALAGGPLAAHVGGPLLLTPGASQSSSLDPEVLQEIERVLPPGGTVYVLGGTLALSPAIESTLEQAGYAAVRIAGANEYATSVDIAQQLGNPSTIFEATGLNFADALSADPAAISKRGAILLTDGNVQAPETAAYLAAHPGDTRDAIGGPLAAYGADPSATPIYGQDLYATSAAVAKAFFPNPSHFGAATGTAFPDALSGGVFIGAPANEGPLLLVRPSGPLPLSIATYLTEVGSGLDEGYLFGGPLAVGPEVQAELASISPAGLQYGPGPMANYTIQPQPAAGSCHYTYVGRDPLPDPACTPGALNPDVTQSTIMTTICQSGYTSSIRPPVTVTEPEKEGSASAYSYTGPFSTGEYDHLVPLELGGDPNDPANLWVEPNDIPGATSTSNTKDKLENKLNTLVCSGQLSLAAAQQAIVTNWVAAYQAYVGALTSANAPPPDTTSPPPGATQPPPSAPATCTAHATPANDGYATDFYVYVHSNQPNQEATVSDATDMWSDETNGTGYVRILLYYTHAGEKITVTVGGATCSTTA